MFNSYEELMATVQERRQDQLVLEVDLGGTYSQEHEDAKAALEQHKALKTLAGDQNFLGDSQAELEARVEATRPEVKLVWIRFKRLDLMEWAVLMKQQNMTPLEQYEKVLNKTFVGVFGSSEAGAPPLSDDPRLLSSQGDMGILPGGSLYNVVKAFMAWQNSGGEVNIHPTRSGQD